MGLLHEPGPDPRAVSGAKAPGGAEAPGGSKAVSGVQAPGSVVCRNTIQSMQAGLVYGHMGLVEFVVGKMKDELHAITGDKPITVVATGGLSSLINSGTDCIDHVDKMLTLEGLELIYEKNRRNRKNRNCDTNEETW